MMMSMIWSAMIFISIVFAGINGTGGALASAVTQGAQAGVTLGISLTGAICLWSGVGRLMERTGITAALAGILMPLIRMIFPDAAGNPLLAEKLSANICANLLGLGNAATPAGIAAARLLRNPARSQVATDQLCRLVVLNTASIQLLPTSVAAIRGALGCCQPFDILPAVWLTSFCSAGLGLSAAWILGRMWRN